MQRQEVPPPPQVPSCRPRNGQSKLARACALGLVTGPHAHTPRTHGQWLTGPGSTPQGRAVGRGGAPNPGHRTLRQEPLPPQAPSCSLHSAQS